MAARPDDAARGDAGPGRAVLVVDDEPAVRRVIAAALRRRGYRVLEAGSGGVALACFDRDDVELVICDYRLPSGTGLELVGRMTRQRPALKVLFMTGYDLADLGDQEAGFRRYPSLQKPFSVEELTRTVDRMWESPS